MKKFQKMLGLAVVVILTLGVVGAASANGGTPASQSGRGGGRGRGTSDQTGTGVPVEMNVNLSERVDDLFSQALADALGIPLDEFLARQEAGETFAQMALDLGFAPEEIAGMMTAARAAALDQAVADGVLTQEEADWLGSRRNGGQNLASSSCTEDCTTEPVMDGFGSQNGMGRRGQP